MKRLRVARDADTDLLEIWMYHFENSEAVADRIVIEISDKYDRLLEFPGMGRSREDLGPAYRSFPAGDYIIYYQEIENGIEISRVLHGARDLADIFASNDEN